MAKALERYREQVPNVRPTRQDHKKQAAKRFRVWRKRLNVSPGWEAGNGEEHRKETRRIRRSPWLIYHRSILPLTLCKSNKLFFLTRSELA